MSIPHARFVLAAALAVATATPLASQAAYQMQLDLAPTDDAHTYNLAPAVAYGSDPTLDIGKVANSPLEVYRGHFLFDLGSLPVGSTIARAELHWWQTSSAAGGLPVNIHPITSAWDEATITWNTNPTYGAKESEVEVGGSPAGWRMWDLTCLARDWQSGITPNRGVVVKDDESPAGASRPGRGVSKEGAVGQRPFLRVLANVAYGGDPGAPIDTVERGIVPVTFRLVDPSLAATNATADFSTDGGATWAPATLAGGGALAGSGLGELLTTTWNSAADAVGLGGATPVMLRVDLTNGVDSAQLAYSFQVDNSPQCWSCTTTVPCAADAKLTNRLECEPHGQDPDLVLNRQQGGSFAIWNRVLFRFDISRVPPGTPVGSATFNYYQVDGGGAGGLTVRVHRVTAPWDEGTVLWGTTPSSDPTPVTTLAVGDVFANGYQQFDVTTLVQDWVDGVFPNHGLIVLGDETAAGASRESYGFSRERAIASQQPFLEIDLGAPPVACSVASPLGGMHTGDVDVDYTLFEGTSTPCSLVPRFSTDGGATWSPASAGPGGDGVSGLASSPGGTPHLFVWDSATDVPAAVGLTAVTLELQVDSGTATSSCSTAFDVDNAPACPLCGDCNENALGPDILDALTAAQVAAGLIVPTPVQTLCCDANASGGVDVLDALVLAQFAAGLPVALVCL